MILGDRSTANSLKTKNHENLTQLSGKRSEEMKKLGGGKVDLKK
jgi:hypothetical protein